MQEEMNTPMVAVFCPANESDPVYRSLYSLAIGHFTEHLKRWFVHFVWFPIRVIEPANDVHRDIVVTGCLFLIETTDRMDRGDYTKLYMDCCVEVGCPPLGGKEVYFTERSMITEIMGIHKNVI